MPPAIAADQAPGAKKVTKPLPVPEKVKVKTGTHKPKKIIRKRALSKDPADLELMRTRIFEEPLIPMTSPAVPGENKALAKAVKLFKEKNDMEDLSALRQFIEDYPKSRWIPSLETSMASISFHTGYLTPALKLWADAWNRSKGEKGSDQMAVANRALCDLIVLNARLGRTDEVKKYLAIAEKRPLFGSDERKVNGAKVAIWQMEKQPWCAYKCGPYAVNTIWNLDKKDKNIHPVIESAQSTTEGTSLAQVKGWADEVGINYVPAKRSTGSRIIVPSVMHWRLGHFAAIVKEEKGKYLLQDPTFDTDAAVWLSKNAIEQESDGYFLVPRAKSMPDGWTEVALSEAQSVRGKGVAIDVNGDEQGPKECEMMCHDCENGMAMASAFSNLATLTISDTPLSYAPPLGPAIDFSVEYNHLQTNQPSTYAYSNFGKNWNLKWLSYITFSGTTGTIRVSDGSSEVYTQSGGAYSPNFMTQALLVDVVGGAYERRLKDGSVQVFSLSDGGSPAKIFMTEVKDPQGNSVLIDYDADYRITEITDGSNQVSTISYVSNSFGNAGFYKIASITDPFGRSCSFTYDDDVANLIKITDVIGLESQFTYDTYSSFITLMRTPYGATSFYQYTTGTTYPSQGLKTVYPDGTCSVIENWVGGPDQTYYWDRHAMGLYPNDPTDHVYTHCKTTKFTHNISTNLMDPTPQTITRPLETSPTYVTYAGSVNTKYSGTINLPGQTTRSLGVNGNLIVNATLGGTATAGNVVTITANYVSVNYTVQSGDTLSDIASGLAAAANASTNFRTRGITAGAVKNVLSLQSDSSALTNGYSYSLSGGATVTVKLNSMVRQTQVCTISGPITVGANTIIHVNKPNWPSDGRVTITYTTVMGDTLTTICSNIASLINADTTCQLYGVSATSSGNQLFLTSYSPDVQTYGTGTTGSQTFAFSNVLNGNTETYQTEYNSLGHVTKTIDPIRRTFSYTYDTNNIDLTDIYETQAGNSYLIGHWDYNSQHEPTSYVDGSARETTYSYNSSGQVLTVEDANSNTTTFTYTGTAEATIGGTPTTSDVLTITTYDAGLSGGQKAVNYTVQGGDSLSDIADGLKDAINNDTDLASIGVTATSSSDTVTISSTSVNVTSYAKSLSGGATETIDLTANRLGYLTKIDGPLSGSNDVTLFSYDGYGRLFTQTDSEGYTLTFYYDNMNRPTKTVYPDGTFEQATYDRLDAALMTDRNGRSTQRAYDSLDQLVYEIDPLGRKTSYTWCDCGSITSLTDANGHTTTWDHDLQGRVTEKTYEDATSIVYTYEARSGRLKSTTDALGQIKTFLYYPDSKLYQTNYSAAVNTTRAATFVWDLNYPRMVSSCKNDWGKYTYTYNNYVTSPSDTPITGGGMLQKVECDAIANSDITYTYDALGRTTNRSIDGANNSIDWTYDAISRVTQEVNELGTFTYAYPDNGSGSSKGITRLKSISYPNSQVGKFSYFDNTGDQRLKQIQNLDPNGALLSQFNYRYDPAGQITQWQQIQNNTSLNYRLGYDQAGQLTAARAGDGSSMHALLKQYNYAYDPGANRTGVQQTDVTRARLGGSVTTSDVLTITVKDEALTGGEEDVNYTVQGGDTLSTIATKLAAAITENSDLQTLGVNASASGQVLSIKSASRNVTSYESSTSGGATELITIGASNNFVENAVIGGTATTSDVLTITVIDPDLTGGKKDKAYTVQGGDGLDDIADGLKTAINADTDLQNIGVSATAVGPVVTIKSTSQNATTYGQSTSANATATIDLFVNQNSAEYLVIGGTKTTSDQISLVVYDADLSGGSKTVTYTVQGGDTLSTIASGLASAVSSDTDLQAIAVSASSSGTVVTIESSSINATTYRATTSSGATETAILGLPQNGVQTAVIGGTKTTSDTLTITVYDAGLSGGSKAVDYVVQSGDDLDAIAAGIATAINGDTDLQNINVSASSSSKVIFINSSSVNATSYTQSVSGGATETITLAPSTSVTQFAYDDVNAITSISASGAARVEGHSNKALKSAEVDSSAVSLNWSQAYSGNTSLSTGNNSVDVEVTDGANNTASASHQVLANSGSSASPTFDDNGNMTSDGTNTYEWDAEDRLIKINYVGTGNYSLFTFDSGGRKTKIVEVSGGSTTSTKQFVWIDGGRPIEERDASGALVKRFYNLGQLNSSTNYFYTRDHLGSVREMTDTSAVIQAQYSYGLFGEASDLISASTPSDFQYARTYNHTRSGLSLASSRAYKANLARFISRDPLIDDTNLYYYAWNNPASFLDPSGLYPVDVKYIDPAIAESRFGIPGLADAYNSTGCMGVVDAALGISFPPGSIGPAPEAAVPPGSTKCWWGNLGDPWPAFEKARKCKEPCPPGTEPVYWCKQGHVDQPARGPVGGPVADPVGVWDNSGGSFNYSVYHQGQFLGGDVAGGLGVQVSPKPWGADSSYNGSMCCRTCKRKK